jgi:hypothetical protein
MTVTMSSTAGPLVIEDACLSRVWARALVHVLDHAGTAISPLLASISGFTADDEPYEDPALRTALDDCLRVKGRLDVETVAWTIFPRSIWRLAGRDRHRLYDLYIKTFPAWRSMNLRANRRGLYFERLVNYGRGPVGGNQLEWILSEYAARPGIRKTMLQASVFDPERDHVRDAQLGFPCLQQVHFVPEHGGLAVRAFYATQQLFDKAYGNWLGLCHLGQFMALEMGLRLVRLNCYVGTEKLERVTKRDPALQPVIRAARASVATGPGVSMLRALP